MRSVLLLTALLPLLLIAAVCSTPEPKTQDIVTTVPWPDQERSQYVLFDNAGKSERGQGTLTVTRKGSQYQLTQHFEGAGNADDSTVYVDASTLKPLSVHRVISGNDQQTVDAAYDATAGVVTVTENSSGKDRTVPYRLKDNYYDNDSSLFLWRTIDFREGYQVSYRSVVTNYGSQQVVSLHVTGKQQVTVPAGTFDAWRVVINTSDRTQTAWFGDTPERPLVQYDNDFNSIFKLSSLSSGAAAAP